MKEDIVNVTRYIRNGSNEGITFLFRVNYETGVVGAKWSVCEGDNFNKQEGIKRARESKMEPLFFYVQDVDTYKGLIPATFAKVEELYGYPSLSMSRLSYYDKAWVFLHLRNLLLERDE